MAAKSTALKTVAHFPAPRHNHSVCARTALEAAERLCETKGARFTEMRRKVLEAIWEGHTPITAYDLLAKLNEQGGRHAPIAVYRALDFLLTHGLAHKISSLNAFIGCTHSGTSHDARFLICRNCHSVAELDGQLLDHAFDAHVAKTGFRVERKIVEVTGLCGFCAGKTPKGDAKA